MDGASTSLGMQGAVFQILHVATPAFRYLQMVHQAVCNNAPNTPRIFMSENGQDDAQALQGEVDRVQSGSRGATIR